MNRLFLLALSIAAINLAPSTAAADWWADMRRLYYYRVKACYDPPQEAKGLEPITVEVRLKPDGTLNGDPQIIKGSPKSILAATAMRAIKECLPVEFPNSWSSRYKTRLVLMIQFIAPD